MNENVKDLPCSPEVNKKLISKYKGEQQNIIFNILNRQNTGYFCKNQRKRCHDHHDAVQPKFIFKGKQRYVAEIILMYQLINQVFSILQ